MGTHDVGQELSGAPLRRFTRRLLADLRALEQMIDGGLIERGVRRIGAEQELFLVDRSLRPALASMAVLERVADPHFTTELGQFNLEINLDPCTFQGDSLGRMERQLEALLAHLHATIEPMGLHAVLAGSLPTMRKSDLGRESMAPIPRYALLADAIDRMRGGHYDFNIRGIDELIVQHETMMLEACNCSFQVHFQVAPDEFAHLYNVAQVVTAPVLAISANSPLLFGRRLWHETRIALFQQSIDTRRSSLHLRERSPRVMFGTRWVERSVLELYREDVSRFRALLGEIQEEDPFAELEAGRVPRLRALTLHNSTVYRWNRACYGQTDGVPHLRIENRVLPSGPTPADEMAGAALWFGLVSGLSATAGDVREAMAFDDAKHNLHLAARLGLGAQLVWLDGRTYPAATLVRDVLLPLAEEGLRRCGVIEEDIARYLGIIDRRAEAEQTGAAWQLRSLAAMKRAGWPGAGGAPDRPGTLADRLSALVGAMIARQADGAPVAEWPLAALAEGGGWEDTFMKVEHYMDTDLFTVNEDESIDLVANLMVWENIRHVPVEDDEHRLVGLVSYRALVRLIAEGGAPDATPMAVSAIMRRDMVTCGPETTTLEAIRLMREHQIGALPVVRDGQLVGIVTQQDFMDVARDLLEERLGGGG